LQYCRHGAAIKNTLADMFESAVATLLDLSLSELNALAERHVYIHPIASRCGVFAKTDVQNNHQTDLNRMIRYNREKRVI